MHNRSEASGQLIVDSGQLRRKPRRAIGEVFSCYYYSMATSEIEIIKNQSRGLTEEQKIELIEFLTRELHRKNGDSTQLRFGKYAASKRRMSAEEDFRVAEWRPADLDLNGN
jgi:hypothetical protein